MRRVAVVVLLGVAVGCADAAAPAGPDPVDPAPSWRPVATWEGGPAWAWMTTAPRTAAGTYRLELRSTLWAWSVVVEDAP